jgi:hypothetical protein
LETAGYRENLSHGFWNDLAGLPISSSAASIGRFRLRAVSPVVPGRSNAIATASRTPDASRMIAYQHSNAARGRADLNIRSEDNLESVFGDLPE